MYTLYEKKALQEISDWEQAKPGLVVKTIDAVGKPITVITENVPRAIRTAVEKALLGFMEMLKDLSYWTYSEKNIIKKARNAGLNVRTIPDLAEHDLEDLDGIARGFFTSGKITAALEGAGCGMGGLGLIAADIPAIMGIMFRGIQQIGSVYGFDMKDPAMLPVIMSIYNAGCCNTVAVKSAALADLHVAAAAMAGKTAYTKVAARTQTSLLVNFIQQSTGGFPAQIAKSISRKKLAQFIPVVGAVVGAGFNYWLMSSTMTAAYMIFRKLHIGRKQSVTDTLPVLISKRAPAGRRSLYFRSR